MLYVIFAVLCSILGIFFIDVTIEVAFRQNTVTLKKKAIAILFLLLIIPIYICIIGCIESKAYKNSEISNVAISEIYQESGRRNSNNFLIVTEDGSTYYVTAQNVYKGDSNYVIKKHHVNATKRLMFWTFCKEYDYEIVVTDTNFKNVPKLK